MDNIPEISVIMPVYNGCSDEKELYLYQSIKSILNQSFKNFEFIIINDGSSDNTAQVLQEFSCQDSRIQLISFPKNKGIVTVLNEALLASRAPLIARQDADDYSLPDRLSVQKDFLDSNPDTVLCGTWTYIVDKNGKTIKDLQHPCLKNDIKTALKNNGCPIVHGSAMFRRDIIIQAGMYNNNSDFKFAEDYEFWTRLAKEGHIIENIPNKVLYCYRTHENRISVRYKLQQEKASRLIMRMAQDIE